MRTRHLKQHLGLGLGLSTVVAIGLGPSLGCLNRPIDPIDARTTSTVVERVTQTGVDKIDLLLAIDNSSSMLDKQKILKDAVPDLVNRLVNPSCVSKETPDDPTMNQPVQPTDPKTPCDDGFQREFPPVLDINIAIVSSSLGGIGSDACQDSVTTANNNDHGELIVRSAMKGNMNNPSETFMSEGFLAWDPDKTTGGYITDAATLASTLQDLVIGTGQIGCGYEQQLESWNRFLVDPNPYLSVSHAPGLSANTLAGTDQTILTERKNFLRANSLLAIILLSDENDCSTIATGVNYAPLNQTSGFYKGSSACSDPTKGPADKCCYSCGTMPSDSSCTDPACNVGGKPATYTLAQDSVNLRCWNQQQRYGFTGLYPVGRYVNALTQLQIDPTHPDYSVASSKASNIVPNPIFSDLSGAGGSVRDPSLVFMAGIVGVPWQEIAVNPASLTEGFKNFDQLTKDGFWEKDVGEPDEFKYPTNSIMIEDFRVRPGMPASQHEDAVMSVPNGGDRFIDPAAPGDLQYTCIFKLTDPNTSGADCATGKDTMGDNPLCDSTTGTTQDYAKAYPGLRELAVLHGLKAQGIPASICPANTDNTAASDYGYRPAVASIIDRLKTKLGGTCLPRKLDVNTKTHDVPCLIIEAGHRDEGQVDCSTIPGRSKVPTANEGAVEAAKTDPQSPTGNAAWNSFCLIDQLEGDPADMSSQRYACQNEEDAAINSDINGWCYIDVDSIPPVGDPALSNVKTCPTGDRRLIRFVNNGHVQSGSVALISCSGNTPTNN